MNAFVEKHQKHIIGILSGWDRLVFRGTLRLIAHLAGMCSYLRSRHILLKDFKMHAQRLTAELIQASAAQAEKEGRPNLYLPSPRTNKEQMALKIAARDGVRQGRICMLRTIEPCSTYELHRHRQAKRLELQQVPRKCLHLYPYGYDVYFGFMGARIQTWFPFAIQLWINGREGLARQMDQEGLAYRRCDNCFPWIADFPRAQALMDRLHTTDWRARLDRIAHNLSPVHEKMFDGFALRYYGSSHQSEWATDIAFDQAQTLAGIYPQLVRGAMIAFDCRDVLRFLGQRFRSSNDEEVTSSYRDRPEGIRIKHQTYTNSVKAYDKAGSVLRTECTINHHRVFSVHRPSQQDPQGPPKRLRMSKGIADLYARSSVSAHINDRYLEALATLDTTARVEQVVSPICRRHVSKGKSIRALRPWSVPDQHLLRAIATCGLAGDFRNRDIAMRLYPDACPQDVSAQVTYLLRLLREHKIIRRLPRTRRYRLTPAGAQIIATIFLTQNATTQQLNKAAA
ncbi:MAG: hypothetical protein JW955_20190 [Sedimentisphaerales bacterium]|nr:hypothetical protein [Sedimentisphaerales bacterium]